MKLTETPVMTADLIAFASLVILVSGLGALAWIDFKTGYLPDTLQIALALGAVATLTLGSPVGIGWIDAALGVFINAIIFWCLRWIVTKAKGQEAMGLGDVKLAAVGGLWLGPWALPYIMLLSALLTLMVLGIVSLIYRKALWKREIPLGPGLAAAIVVSYCAALWGMPGIVGPFMFNPN